jgi:acetyltransferase-like isoleucine patch superfamily enzyme
MNSYFDRTIFNNPLYQYFRWLTMKIHYQTKYWGSHLRLEYNSYVKRVTFGKNNNVGKNTVLIDCEIGNYTYFSNDSTITNAKIGKFCSIGPGVKIAPGKHPSSKFVSTHPSTFFNPPFKKNNLISKSLFEGNEKVYIGNDVWIGANCLLIDGISIGDGVIVGANSVVTKNVEPYSIVGGVPAKFIRNRFTKEEIAALMSFKWWDKDDDWIGSNINSFWDIRDFTHLIDSE